VVAVVPVPFFVVVAVIMMAVFVTVAVVMMVMVCGVGMFVGQEVGVDVQNGVQIEAADIQQGFQVGFTEVNRRDGCARIDAYQAVAKIFVIGIGHQVFLGHQDLVGKTHLFLGLFLVIQRFHAMLGVDHRDNGIEAVVVGNFIVHEERLADGAGVGHAGGFDDDPFEIEPAVAA